MAQTAVHLLEAVRFFHLQLGLHRSDKAKHRITLSRRLFDSRISARQAIIFHSVFMTILTVSRGINLFYRTFAHMTRANTENWRKFIKSSENSCGRMAHSRSQGRALSLSQHENRDHSPGSRIISVCSALLEQYRIIEQERFASKFCVLTRRGFAVIRCITVKSQQSQGTKKFPQSAAAFIVRCCLKALCVISNGTSPFCFILLL